MTAHQIRMAMPGTVVARQLGINRNHHARVWCSCMDNPSRTPGYYSHRSQADVVADPRRLGAFDDLGVVDVREPGSAVELWRTHLQEAA